MSSINYKIQSPQDDEQVPFARDQILHIPAFTEEAHVTLDGNQIIVKYIRHINHLKSDIELGSDYFATDFEQKVKTVFEKLQR